MTALDPEIVRQRLRTRTFGQRLVCLASTTSTQDVCKALAEQGAPEGSVVVADLQTTGRGRLDRTWIAPSGAGLLLSVLFRPRLLPSQVHRLSMLCSLAVSDAIFATCELRTGIKWPNDVVTWPVTADEEPRKLAGLIAEAAFSGDRVTHVVVGIGVNVTVDPATLPATIVPATSILAETGRSVSRESLLWRVLEGIEFRYGQLTGDPDGPHHLADTWKSRLVTLGREVSASDSHEVIAGLAHDVDEDGRLIVRGADGSVRLISAGDVTLRPPSAGQAP